MKNLRLSNTEAAKRVLKAAKAAKRAKLARLSAQLRLARTYQERSRLQAAMALAASGK